MNLLAISPEHGTSGSLPTPPCPPLESPITQLENPKVSTPPLARHPSPTTEVDLTIQTEAHLKQPSDIPGSAASGKRSKSQESDKECGSSLEEERAGKEAPKRRSEDGTGRKRRKVGTADNTAALAERKSGREIRPPRGKGELPFVGTLGKPVGSE